MFTTILTQNQQAVLELLKEPVASNGFYLAGGTALALHLGHRKSLDFDFFRNEPIDTPRLKSLFSQAEIRQETRGTLTVSIKGVKVSFFEFPYPLLKGLSTDFVFSLASIEDIAAMKISAIAGRGSKRDFVDLCVIAEQALPLAQCLALFNKKFSSNRTDVYHILRSLSYFEDAEQEEMPEMLLPLTWDNVKIFFVNEVKNLTGN